MATDGAKAIAEYQKTVIVIDNAKKTSVVEQQYVVSELVAGPNDVALPALPRHVDPETLQISSELPVTVTSWTHGRMVADAERELQERLKNFDSDSNYAKMLSKIAEEFAGALVTVKKVRGKYKKTEDIYSGKLVAIDDTSAVLVDDSTKQMVVIPVADIVAVTISLGDDVGKLACTIKVPTRAVTAHLRVRYAVGNIEFSLWYNAVISNKSTSEDASACTLRLSAVARIENKSGGSYASADVSAVFPGEMSHGRQFEMADSTRSAKRSYSRSMPMQTMAAPPSMSAFGSGDTVTLNLGQNIALTDGHTTGTMAFDHEIQAAKFYKFTGSEKVADAEIVVRWKNDIDTGIGRALPAGKVRTSERVDDAAESTLDEVEISSAIEVDEVVEWNLGNTDKVTAQRKKSATTVRNSNSLADQPDWANFNAKNWVFTINNKMPNEIVARIVINVGHPTWEIANAVGDSWTKWVSPKWKRPEPKKITDTGDLNTVMFDIPVNPDTVKDFKFMIIDLRDPNA